MKPPTIRLARARDYAVTGLGAAFLTLAVIFLAGRIWFRALFAAALDGDPLIWAAGSLAVAVLLGILHTFATTPLTGGDPRA